MPSHIATPGSTNAIDRLTLGTEAVRGTNSSTWAPPCGMCAEFEATPSIPGTCSAPCICADAE